MPGVVIIVAGLIILLSGCSHETGITQPADNENTAVEPGVDNKTSFEVLPPGEEEEEETAEPVKEIGSGDVIDLSKQGLTEFPIEILKKIKTKKLILSHNSLKTLPAEIGELVNLEELYLDNNLLDGALVAEIRKMPKLRILDASNNNMTGIPAEIGQLNNLRTLNYASNSLDTMPNEIENLVNLKTLDLSDNNYSPEMLELIEMMLPQTRVIY